MWNIVLNLIVSKHFPDCTYFKIKTKHYDEKRKYRKEYTEIHLTSGVHVFCKPVIYQVFKIIIVIVK